MACNCGKRKAPHGAQAQARATAKKAAARPTAAKLPPPAGAGAGAKAAGQKQSYTLQTTDGRTMTFGSRLERDATRVRIERGLR